MSDEPTIYDLLDQRDARIAALEAELQQQKAATQYQQSLVSGMYDTNERLEAELQQARAGIEKNAAAIVDALFVNGQGESAKRLVLVVDGPPRRDLGGWSKRGAFDQIVKALRDAPGETP